jgi:hypothetical protein
MAARQKLSDKEKAFFSLVSQAVRANPFSEERAAIDIEIAGLYPDTPYPDRIAAVINEVRKRITRLESNNRADINHYSGKDKTILHNAILFDFFHLFLERFDAHIEDQVRAGDTPVRVAFADKALAFLVNKGFDRDEAARYFSLAFQLRRTFYFIDRGLKGGSTGMINLKKGLWNNVFTNSLDIYNQYLWNRMEDFSTLILGETGTGKGTVAAAIGRSGFIPFDTGKKTFQESFARSFVSINLSQFPEALIESELFGHKKGAFTGAVNDHKGVLDQSSPWGAIFLDEIGEVSIPVQIKLLKVLEERIFFPVGSHTPHRFEGRIIAATNRPVEEITEKRILRQDFFYRLCSDIIIVPPLRRRIKEDPAELKALLSFTIERILGKPSPDLVDLVQKAIDRHPGADYHWPGNVRELAQCVRRVLLNHNYAGLSRTETASAQTGLAGKLINGDMDALNLTRWYCHLLYGHYGTYGEVARRTNLDRRTVKKYIAEWEKEGHPGFPSD